MQTKARILLVVHTNTWFTELFRVARMLSDSGEFEPVLHFAIEYDTLERDFERCRESGIAFTTSKLFTEYCASRRQTFLQRLAAVLQRVARFLRPLAAPGEALETLAEHKIRLEFDRSLIALHSPQLLILAGDMAGYDTAHLIAAARDAGLRTLLIPSTMSNGLEQAEVYYHNPLFQTTSSFNRLVSRLFPRWMREHRGRRLLRLPAKEIVALEFLNLAPPMPWIFNSGAADAIAVESNAMRDYYIACKLPQDKLFSTGSVANDYLARGVARRVESKDALLRSLGLDPDKPLIVSPLVPDFLYVGGGRPECDFQDYGSLVRHWVDALAACRGWNTVLSLHPSVQAGQMSYLESDNVRIARDNIIELIPLCDLFVASVSSTIRWALACGKPVLNYDVYRYRYTDYVDVDGIIIVEERAEFLEFLKRLTEDSEYRKDVQKRIERQSDYWGRLDGNEGGRIKSLIRTLIENEQYN